jgi:hypothetical protein
MRAGEARVAARIVESEWLDHLAPLDPRARRSRRDLQRLNALMRNAPIVARALSRVHHERMPGTVVELGAGDGAWMAQLAGTLRRRGGSVRAVLLDRQESVEPAALSRLAALGWRAEAITADAFDWLAHGGERDLDVVVVNLFLHHFERAALAALLALVARRARTFVACEPRRSALPLAMSRMVGLIGCNDVTRHDAVASVRAGFRGRELSALWPSRAGWHLEERSRGLFSHVFVAAREPMP